MGAPGYAKSIWDLAGTRGVLCVRKAQELSVELLNNHHRIGAPSLTQFQCGRVMDERVAGSERNTAKNAPPHHGPSERYPRGKPNTIRSLAQQEPFNGLPQGWGRIAHLRPVLGEPAAFEPTRSALGNT
jgi:hypothetical protein